MEKCDKKGEIEINQSHNNSMQKIASEAEQELLRSENLIKRVIQETQQSNDINQANSNQQN